ncbi:MAG: hypothetical protein H7Y06_03090 [Opitutaceae bacterium]|nr:hypothetical protein [Opitutaceae bacterium]
MRPRDNRFNTPAEMLVRLVFASRFIFFCVSLVLSLFAFHHGSPIYALKALVFFAAMIASHVWLKRGNKLAECERALEAMFSGETSDDEEGLEALLSRREALEEKRGTPGFDPWAVQALRREISDYVKTHPESTRRFDGR